MDQREDRLARVLKIISGYTASAWSETTSYTDLAATAGYGLTELTSMVVAHDAKTSSYKYPYDAEPLIDACHAVLRIAELRGAHLDMFVARYHVEHNFTELTLSASEAYYGFLRILFGDEPYDALEYETVVLATQFANAALFADNGGCYE